MPPQGRILVLWLLLDHQKRLETSPLGEMACDLVFFSSKIEASKKESGETTKEDSSLVDVDSALLNENGEVYKEEDFD